MDLGRGIERLRVCDMVQGESDGHGVWRSSSWTLRDQYTRASWPGSEPLLWGSCCGGGSPELRPNLFPGVSQRQEIGGRAAKLGAPQGEGRFGASPAWEVCRARKWESAKPGPDTPRCRARTSWEIALEDQDAVDRVVPSALRERPTGSYLSCSGRSLSWRQAADLSSLGTRGAARYPSTGIKAGGYNRAAQLALASGSDQRRRWAQRSARYQVEHPPCRIRRPSTRHVSKHSEPWARSAPARFCCRG